MNEGKRWEDNFRKGMTKRCIRLYDTTNGFAGVKNPCDFLYYLYPYQFMFECKSVKGQRLGYSYITKNQWENLQFFNGVYGVNPMIAVEFREVNRAFVIPFSYILRTHAQGKKSVTVLDCENSQVIQEIPCDYKRTNCTIRLQEFQLILLGMAEQQAIKFEE